MTYVTCRLTAKNHDQLGNPTLGNRVWATFLLVNCEFHTKWTHVQLCLLLLLLMLLLRAIMTMTNDDDATAAANSRY